MSDDTIARLMAIAGRSKPDLAPDQSAAAARIEPPMLALPDASDQVDDADAASADAPPRRVARRRPAGPVRGKIAANDDVPSIGGLIYALEQKPSTKVFRIAALASVLWAIAGVAFGLATLAPAVTQQSTWWSLAANPVTFMTAAAVFVPIAIFWLLAVLNWHISSLALKSSTMTEVAIRLAEPDRAAEQSVASLGQAVRRQVSFMNDAVSRALGRAGELEALVHNQVADLERSYEQNERRIRDLIQELSGERHALLNTSGSVTETLKSLGTEIPMLIEKLSTQQVTLAGIIKGAGENLAALEGSLATSTGRFENALGQRTQHLQTVLEDYTSAFSTALSNRTEQMRLTFDGYMQTLDSTLGARTENLQTVFEEYALALDTTLANRAQALDMQLVERSQSLDQAFQRRLERFDDQIVRSTSLIDGAVGEKAQLLSKALEIHASTFRDTISRQALDLDESVMNGINAVRRTSENITRQTMKAIDGLQHQSTVLQNVSENLFSQIHGVTDRFENQGQQILRAASVLDDANVRIDSTLQTRHADLTKTLERLSGKADEFGRTMAGYSSNLEGSMSTMEMKARELTAELREGVEARSRALMTELERVKMQTEAASERTVDELRSRFQMVSTDLTKEFQTLAMSLSSATDETRLRASQAAQTLAYEQARIREEAARLPSSTRELADNMRRSLQEQMRALEHLTHLAGRGGYDHEIVHPESYESSPARLAPPPPTPLQPRNKLAGDGWSLGDLLARASHDDDALAEARANAEAARQPFRLDVGVIARALDPATASAVWNRIRAGQRSVMVRSIYAADVRAVFDQVAARVNSDADLNQTVMRYLADFERIVKEADGRDPSGRLTHTHLVSDTGRVYLFLAHAAGRLA